MAESREQFDPGMKDADNHEKKCEFCGRTIKHVETNGNIRVFMCDGCKSTYHIDTVTNKLITKKMFSDETGLHEIVKSLVYQNDAGRKRLNRRDASKIWQDAAELINRTIQNYSGININTARMCYLACQTELFRTFPKIKEDRLTAIQKVTVESAGDYSKGKNASDRIDIQNYRILQEWYNNWQKQRKKRQKRRAILLGGTAITVALLMIVGSIMYRPAKFDSVSGVQAQFSWNALSPTRKFFLTLRSEKIGRQTDAYAAAETTLADRCGNFALYDIGFTQFSDTVKPGAPVTVTIDIPPELNNADLCVYHIDENGNCTELTSQVSYATHTISFETTHFSLFAVAEKAYHAYYEVDGEIVHTQKYLLGDSPSKPADPAKTGYEFDGWFNGSTPWRFAENTVSADITLTAQWKPQTYTVTFDPGEGVVSEQRMSVSFDTMVALPVPTRQNYVFDGWYDGDGTHVPDGTWTIPHDTALTAHWKGKAYTVRFEANGGEGEMPAASGEYGTAFQVPTCAFVKKGYTAVGWTEDPLQKQASYPFGSRLREINAEAETEIVLYPVWTPNENTLAFSASGGQGTMDSVKVLTGEQIVIPTCRFTKGDLMFVGWSTEADGGVAYKPGDQLFMPPNDITLYAVWLSPNITISLNANGGTVQPGSVVRNRRDPYGVLPVASREGYQFKGWSTTGEERDIITEKTMIPAENAITLYAVWIANKYTVAFNKNTPKYGTNPSEVMNTMACVYDVSRTLPANNYKIDGWIFKGWATKADGDVVYQDKAAVINLTATFGETITLYAVWVVDPYTVAQTVANGVVVTDTNKANTYTVYNDIHETPQITCRGKVILDWSGRGKGEYSFPDAVGATGMSIKNATEVFLIGDPEAIYEMGHIGLDEYAKGETVKLYFVDFNMKGHLGSRNNGRWKDDGMLLTVAVRGRSSINAPDGMAAIASLEHVTVTGSGTFSVRGGNGTDGASAGASGTDGCVGIDVTNLTVNMTGTLYVFGGGGGNGANGNDGTNAGKYYHSAGNGESGGNGGNGGDAIRTKNTTVDTPNALYLSGGSGGDGGNGGNGGNGKRSTNWLPFNFHKKPGNGGNGGDGGKGGMGGKVGLDHALRNSANGIGGAGGNAGHGGECGSFYWNPWIGKQQNWYGNTGSDGAAGSNGKG